MADNRDIEIKLLGDQYRRLIELAYLGEWVVNAHHDVDFQDDDASATLQAVLGAHVQAGVGRDDETGNFYLETEWSDRLFDRYIADYDDHVFWDELTERLAVRDLARARGVGIDEIEREDELPALKPLEEKYRRELEDNGIDGLELGRGY